MLPECGTRHKRPHCHARYGQHSASFALDGTVLAGELPPRQAALVRKWIRMRQEELQACWALLDEGETPPKIEPLR